MTTARLEAAASACDCSIKFINRLVRRGQLTLVDGRVPVESLDIIARMAAYERNRDHRRNKERRKRPRPPEVVEILQRLGFLDAKVLSEPREGVRVLSRRRVFRVTLAESGLQTRFTVEVNK